VKNPRLILSINVTYGIELEGLCSKVDGSIHIIDGRAHGSGAGRWLSAGKGTGASGEGKEGGGGLHCRVGGGNGGMIISYRTLEVDPHDPKSSST
jgi:hypothetical protein